MNEVLKQIPNLNPEVISAHVVNINMVLHAFLQSILGSKYYKGGFDVKMSKREAALILGVSPTANKLRIKEAHKRIMLLNHPDKGGSPYLAAKINEAKDYMDTTK